LSMRETYRISGAHCQENAPWPEVRARGQRALRRAFGFSPPVAALDPRPVMGGNGNTNYA